MVEVVQNELGQRVPNPKHPLRYTQAAKKNSTYSHSIEFLSNESIFCLANFSNGSFHYFIGPQWRGSLGDLLRTCIVNGIGDGCIAHSRTAKSDLADAKERHVPVDSATKSQSRRFGSFDRAMYVTMYKLKLEFIRLGGLIRCKVQNFPA